MLAFAAVSMVFVALFPLHSGAHSLFKIPRGPTSEGQQQAMENSLQQNTMISTANEFKELCSARGSNTYEPLDSPDSYLQSDNKVARLHFNDEYYVRIEDERLMDLAFTAFRSGYRVRICAYADKHPNKLLMLELHNDLALQIGEKTAVDAISSEQRRPKAPKETAIRMPRGLAAEGQQQATVNSLQQNTMNSSANDDFSALCDAYGGATFNLDPPYLYMENDNKEARIYFSDGHNVRIEDERLMSLAFMAFQSHNRVWICAYHDRQPHKLVMMMIENNLALQIGEKTAVDAISSEQRRPKAPKETAIKSAMLSRG